MDLKDCPFCGMGLVYDTCKGEPICNHLFDLCPELGNFFRWQKPKSPFVCVCGETLEGYTFGEMAFLHHLGCMDQKELDKHKALWQAGARLQCINES